MRKGIKPTRRFGTLTEEGIMHIGIAADHGGFELKGRLGELLQAEGHQMEDYGAHEFVGDDDYPDFVVPMARAVAGGEVVRGIAICGSGVGAAVAANKLPGIRAGLCNDSYSAHQGVEHDDMNVLVMGGLVVGREVARELARIFLAARYGGEPRHQRRIEQIRELERRYGARGWEGEP